MADDDARWRLVQALSERHGARVLGGQLAKAFKIPAAARLRPGLGALDQRLQAARGARRDNAAAAAAHGDGGQDRKSTRLNSSHSQISYAVFCLKKKKTRNVIGINGL